ncbi:MAG: hypothetical protein ACYTAQ_07170, partial [Planctomycetota bacterium]
HAGDRLVLVLEGGYDLGALAESAHACLEVLAASSPSPRPSPPAEFLAAAGIIRQMRAAQGDHWPLAERR